MLLFLGNLEVPESYGVLLSGRASVSVHEAIRCDEGKFLCQIEPDTYICVTKQDIENNKKKHAYLAASHVCYLKWAKRL